MEQLLIKASYASDFEEELKAVCDFYKDDFNSDDLKAQLVMFGVEFQQKNNTNTEATTIFDIMDHFKAYSIAQRDLLRQVVRVLQLIMVMPATNATSERSFSALRRVKNYLSYYEARETEQSIGPSCTQGEHRFFGSKGGSQ